MLTLKTLSVLAVAGSALAAPTIVEREWRGGWSGRWSSEYTAVEPSTVTVSQPAPTAAAPEPSSTNSNPSAGSSGDGSYISIVEHWREAMGLPDLSQDGQLEANALKTSSESGGSLTHQLNPGSMAQVMAPGDSSNFESVYLGGWLCEVPSAPGLNGACDSASQGWNHQGQTGHAEILTSTSYSKIGCALASGIWTCDLA